MANYLSSTEREDKEMLQAVGVERFSDLYQDIPFELRNKPLNIPNGKSLQEVSDEMQALADKNVNYACIMRGAGASSSGIRRYSAKYPDSVLPDTGYKR